MSVGGCTRAAGRNGRPLSAPPWIARPQARRGVSRDVFGPLRHSTGWRSVSLIPVGRSRSRGECAARGRGAVNDPAAPRPAHQPAGLHVTAPSKPVSAGRGPLWQGLPTCPDSSRPTRPGLGSASWLPWLGRSVRLLRVASAEVARPSQDRSGNGSRWNRRRQRPRVGRVAWPAQPGHLRCGRPQNGACRCPSPTSRNNHQPRSMKQTPTPPTAAFAVSTAACPGTPPGARSRCRSARTEIDSVRCRAPANVVPVVALGRLLRHGRRGFSGRIL
jgi:hypothetical protein